MLTLEVHCVLCECGSRQEEKAFSCAKRKTKTKVAFAAAVGPSLGDWPQGFGHRVRRSRPRPMCPAGTPSTLPAASQWLPSLQGHGLMQGPGSLRHPSPAPRLPRQHRVSPTPRLRLRICFPTSSIASWQRTLAPNFSTYVIWETELTPAAPAVLCAHGRRNQLRASASLTSHRFVLSACVWFGRGYPVPSTHRAQGQVPGVAPAVPGRTMRHRSPFHGLDNLDNYRQNPQPKQRLTCWNGHWAPPPLRSPWLLPPKLRVHEMSTKLI